MMDWPLLLTNWLWIMGWWHERRRRIDMPADSVHCVVTSPPYWGLRDYGTPPQVWGGDPDCRHRWGSERLIPTGNAPSAKSTLTTQCRQGPAARR
jgi:site-specific DNA-methyltransferase (cytosine-N4-specific)